MDDITRLDDHFCPHCDKKQNAAGGTGSPEPGDYGVCIGCAGIGIYDDLMGLRKPTSKEHIEAQFDDDLYEKVEMIQFLLRQKEVLNESAA